MRRLYYLILGFFSLSATNTVHAGFVLPSWDLVSGVFVVGDDFDYDELTVVQNPFQTSVEAHLGGSSVNSSYDFTWTETVGHFSIESNLAVEGLASSLVFATSENRINITPSTPITVNVHAEYTFNLPVDHMSTDFGFGAAGMSTNTVAFLDFPGFDTSMGPGADTFVIDGQFTLPPTETWQLMALMRIDSYPGTQGTGTGSGFFDIQIVPEPTTLSLFCAGILLSRRRRSRRHDSSRSSVISFVKR